MSTHHPGKRDTSKPSSPSASSRPKEQHPHAHAGKTEKRVDQTVEDTFPASDPPAVGGVTKLKSRDTASDSQHAAQDKTASKKHH